MVRQAAFKGLREDKPAKEVEAEKPANPTSTDVPSPSRPASPARPPRSPGKPVVMGVLISNPDKALWPDAGDGEPVTKLDLASYFEQVGSWLIGHIKGRPCSIIRAPNGSNLDFSNSISLWRRMKPATAVLRANSIASERCGLRFADCESGGVRLPAMRVLAGARRRSERRNFTWFSPGSAQEEL